MAETAEQVKSTTAQQIAEAIAEHQPCNCGEAGHCPRCEFDTEGVVEILEREHIPYALAQLQTAMSNSPDYAHTWHCNIACCALDEGIEHEVANKIASRFMQLAFKVKDSASPA